MGENWKLFEDTVGVTTIRPTRITQHQETQLLEDIALNIISQGFSNDDIKDIITDLSELSINDTGYEMVKDLESNGYADYDIDASFIELIESISVDRNSILMSNVALWVKANNPIPKYNRGERLRILKKVIGGFPINSIVFITRINPTYAKYVVSNNPNSNSGQVFTYEWLELNSERRAD